VTDPPADHQRHAFDSISNWGHSGCGLNSSSRVLIGGTMQSGVLNIDLSQVNGSAFVRVEGEIDAESVGELSAVLEGLRLDKQVVVDMAGVRFIDSSGIRALVQHRLRIDGTGGSLRISNPSRPVERLVHITGLADVLLDPQGK
jgi:anti-anti-sigma factor